MSDRTQRRDDRRGASRSRSPPREGHHAHRTRSPHHHHHHYRHQHYHHHHKRSPTRLEVLKELPYGARKLTKRDFAVFRPMFELYLDIQKRKVLDSLDEAEVKGRWKSFIGKWNCGELAEGWYDPSTLQKAALSMETQSTSRDLEYEGKPKHPSEEMRAKDGPRETGFDPFSDSDDSVGPALPGRERHSRVGGMGPRIPNMEDLELRREMENEDALTRVEDMRSRRKVDRKLQKEALDELVPRADAGTFERRLEKKAAVNVTMKSFRDRSPGAVEIPETELMGGGDGVADYQRQKREYERKKNERELRKEEILRARAAEREERLEEYRIKEDKTMDMLKALARQRFG